MKIGSLFSGIGGIEIGFEKAGGFETVWFVEKDPYTQAVLRKHWPKTPIYKDIKNLDFSKVEKPDILTGGFPCQDISTNGKRKGLSGPRSGLWKEFARAIRCLRPRFAFIENVSNLTNIGLNEVLADLAEIGYDAEWFDIRASDFKAPHIRERIFIVAYFNCYRQKRRGTSGKALEKEVPSQLFTFDKKQMENAFKNWEVELPESYVRRMADGVPNWSHRIKCLGNAVVPQVAEFFARQIKEIEGLKYVFKK